MSAFVLSENHINALLNWANRHGMRHLRLPDGHVYHCDSTEDLQAMAEILHAENVRSVCHRYPDDKPESYPAPTHHLQLDRKGLTPVEVLKACACYDYQACETGDYPASAAARIIDTIRHAAIAALPGYNAAPWEID